MSISRLAIGTAQFGLDYGITNTRGKVVAEEVTAILTEARRAGVRVLDTAEAYGSAEEILGVNDATSVFRVVTKIRPATPGDVSEKIERCMTRLQTPVVDTVLIHDTNLIMKDINIWHALAKMVSDGMVKKIGLSAYCPADVNDVIKLCDERKLPLPSVIQIPFNVFDQRCLPHLPGWKKMGIEIHARSLYLQGAAFLPPEELPPYLSGLGPALVRLNDLAKQLNVSSGSLLLAFGLLQTVIDYLVIGIDSLQRFRDTLQLVATACDLAENLRLDAIPSSNVFETLRVDDEALINPAKWKNTP